MTMSGSEALAMPSNYAVMDQEEMMYLEGGGVAVRVEAGMLNKTTCQIIAGGILGSTKLKGMTGLEVAQELYAHAVVYFGVGLSIIVTGVNNSILQKIMRAAGTVDLDDGGDPRPGFRQAYAWIWRNVG